jgi:Uma2 family endonuclease
MLAGRIGLGVSPKGTRMADLAASPEAELRMSREDYGRWAEAQPKGRFERIEGIVVAMAPERAGHNDLKMQGWLALRQVVAAAGLPCHVYGDGMTVQSDDSDFEPDVVLHCGERLPPDAITVPEPLVVVEVLSPSTRGGDLTRKLVGYFRVPSVQHYLVFWVDRPQVVHHRRGEDGQRVDTRMLTEGEIRLDPPGISIALAAVYGG